MLRRNAEALCNTGHRGISQVVFIDQPFCLYREQRRPCIDLYRLTVAACFEHRKCLRYIGKSALVIGLENNGRPRELSERLYTADAANAPLKAFYKRAHYRKRRVKRAKA